MAKIIGLDDILEMHLDHGYTALDYGRIMDRFPIPGLEEKETVHAIEIEDLELHDHVTALCVRTKVLRRGTTRFGKPFLKIDLSDETGRIRGWIWGSVPAAVDRLVEKIGAGRLAEVNGFVSEFPIGSGDLQFTVTGIDFDSVHTSVGVPRRLSE